MAERFNATVLKTVEAQVSGGSNPSLSAKIEMMNDEYGMMNRVLVVLLSTFNSSFRIHHSSFHTRNYYELEP